MKRYRKTFEPDQKSSLMTKEDSDNPLYLLAALEELRTLGTYEEITHRINELPETICSLFIWILKRLENENEFQDYSGKNVGNKLVSEFVSLIGVSRHGLSQIEITELIDFDDPQGNIAALQRLLRPFLMYKGELIDFFHGQLAEAVEKEYLKKEKKLEFHRKLAEYFYTKADPLKDASWIGKHRHAFSELSYHQYSANMDNVEDTFIDLRFIEAKCNYGMLFDLIEDLDSAIKINESLPLIQMRSALALSLQALESRPNLAVQSIYNRLKWMNLESIFSKIY